MSKDGNLISKIKNAVATLDVDELRMALSEAFRSGLPGIAIVSEGIMKGIKHSGDIGLIIAAEILKDEIDNLIEVQKKKKSENKSKILRESCHRYC